jgi:peptidoglycan/xylan/chitin deacetylase (PgdA/CDA1 family)
MQQECNQKGTLVISLDLELFWGTRDLYRLDDQRERLSQVRTAIPRILDLFERHGVHATWATVGFLFAENRRELLQAVPAIQPEYSRCELSPYPSLTQLGFDEQEDPYHYGASIIEAVLNTPHQEIGTHTFSHFYCLEDGQTEAAFRSDLEAAARMAAKWKVQLRSLVFPRNQVNPGYLCTLKDLGIQSYRGAGSNWIYRERKRSDESQFRRAVRLLDAYFNLSGHHTFDLDDIGPEAPFNFPASRLLREYSPALRILEPLRVARICSGLNYAAKTQRVYHLWFHPEELALNIDQNMRALRNILTRFVQLRDRGEMESLGMAELSARMMARNRPQAMGREPSVREFAQRLG